MNHRTMIRYAALHAPRPANRSAATSRARREPEVVQRNSRPFQEDFNLEHSLGRVTVTVFDLSAAADPQQPSTGAQEFSSLTCVYLG